MQVDRWRRMMEVFDEVAALPREEHATALRQACGRDATLRKAVEALLEGDEQAGTDFLAGLAVDARPSDSGGALPLPAERIGAYRLIETIGEGGMGTVFLAERDDGAFERQVAIKVIRRGTESAEAVRRLEAERRILAGLDHPAIARLLDAGTTAAGLPYFVMEAVDGVTIDRFCENLSIDRRVALCLEVCYAVDAAHRNLIVHRDLKPSNILVTPDGQPKVLDFGIAKWLDPEPSNDDVSTTTASWQRLLTPSYASPEQVQGRPLTTASDVYSLGVVLYQLLTGRLPFRFEGRSLGEIERLKTDVPPLPPSSAAAADSSSPAMRRRLHGDLDHIVLKALRGDVAERYRSAAQLAEDLERWRRGLPVLARQGNVSYRLGSLLRRHRLAAGVTVAILGLLFAFATDRAIQSSLLAEALERSESERREARLERDAKERVLDLIVDLFRFGDPEESGGETLTVREALDRSQARLDLLQLQPEVEATLRRAVGLIYLHLGELDQAEPHLERSLEIQTLSHGDDSFEAALSRSELGQVVWRKGEFAEARRLLQDAVDRVRRLRGDRHRDLIEPLNTLVAFLCWTEAYREAIEPSIEAYDLASRLTDAASSQRVAAVTHRAIVARHGGDIEQALRLYDESLAANLAWKGSEHPDTAAILNNLGVLWREHGDVARALDLHRRALATRRKLYPDGHDEVAQSLYHIAKIEAGRGANDRAEALFTEAFELLLDKYGAGHPPTARLAAELTNLWLDDGRSRRAARLLETHLGVWRQAFPGRHGGRSWLESTLGAALAALGRYPEAEALLASSQAVFDEHYPDGHPRIRKNLERLLALYTAWPKPAAAAEVRRRLAT